MPVQNLRSHALIEKSSVLAHLLSEAAQARMHQAAAADDKNVCSSLDSLDITRHTSCRKY